MRKSLFNHKSILIGIIVACFILAGGTALAKGITKTIKVAINSVTVKVNGKSLSGNRISYNGSVYVSAKSIANLVGKDYKVDNKGNISFSIKDKSTAKPMPTKKPMPTTLVQTPKPTLMPTPAPTMASTPAPLSTPGIKMTKAITIDAVEITATSARLVGVVDAYGVGMSPDSMVYMEYWETNNPSQKYKVGETFTCYYPAKLLVRVDSLKPNTSYAFRIVATGLKGETVVFNTQAIPTPTPTT